MKKNEVRNRISLSTSHHTFIRLFTVRTGEVMEVQVGPVNSFSRLQLNFPSGLRAKPQPQTIFGRFVRRIMCDILYAF